MVLKDCAKCLGLNPRNIKALYRSARALYALDRCDEAIDCCDHGLAAEPTNLALKAHREKCVARKTEVEEKRKAKEDRERKELERQEALAKAIEVGFLWRVRVDKRVLVGLVLACVNRMLLTVIRFPHKVAQHQALNH